MIPLDLSGKVALVTGVGDNESFAWFISKALQAAGARIVLACHPRVVGIVESFLTRDMDKESRKLPYVDGELKAERHATRMPCHPCRMHIPPLSASRRQAPGHPAAVNELELMIPLSWPMSHDR